MSYTLITHKSMLPKTHTTFKRISDPGVSREHKGAK